MGTQVLATADYETKPQYVVSTVAFGSVAVGDGEFASFIGANAANQLEAYNGLEKCKEKLREAGWPNPGTGVVVESIYDVLLQQFTDTLSEDCVAIIRGSDFTKVSDSCSGHAQRQAELWLESTAKAA